MELISKVDLLKQIGADSRGIEGSYGDTWKFLDTIKNMPVVESRAEGQWLIKTGRVWARCSACKSGSNHTSKYCPNCGATMKKELANDTEAE